jgi:flagellar protein FlaG
MRIDIIQPPEMPKIPKVSEQQQAGKVNAESSGTAGGEAKSFGRSQIEAGAADGGRTADEVKKVIKQMIDSVLDDQTSLQFQINDKTHRIVIQVVNNKTKEVVRQIPPEKVVETMASICKLVGINVDERA